MSRSHRHAILASLSIFPLILTGCASGSPQEALLATLPPAPTPTPGVSITASANLVPGTEAGEWVVVGLAEAATESIQHPRLVIALLDASGDEFDRRTIDLPVDPLAAGSGWPFRETFRPAHRPTSVEAELIGRPSAAPATPRVNAEVLSSFLDAQGRTTLLGRLTLDGSGAARIVRLRLLGRDTDAHMLDVIEAEPAQSVIGKPDPVPFLARLPVASDAISWEPFPIVAAASAPQPRIEWTQRETYIDDQGNVFLTARFDNTSEAPIRLRATAVLVADGAWRAADDSSIPVPIGAGAAASVTFLWPASILGADTGPTDVECLLFQEEAPADRDPVGLPVEVVGYEPAGSSLLVRVRLTLPADGVSEASVSAVLQREDGRVVSAAWGAAPEGARGAEPVVVLALPLPRRFDLTLSELTVDGWGLPSE